MASAMLVVKSYNHNYSDHDYANIHEERRLWFVSISFPLKNQTIHSYLFLRGTRGGYSILSSVFTNCTAITAWTMLPGPLVVSKYLVPT